MFWGKTTALDHLSPCPMPAACCGCGVNQTGSRNISWLLLQNKKGLVRIVLILSALLVSLSFNLDNIVIGIAYGIKKIRIGLSANLIIALVTAAGTFLSMAAGQYISDFLPVGFANGLGAVIMELFGLYFVVQSIFTLKKNKKSKELALKDVPDMLEYAEKSDLNHNGSISIKEAVLVGLGLMVNNLGTGIAASITHIGAFATAAATFFISLLTLSFGNYLGKRALGNLVGKYASLISGCILVLLGILEYCR